MFSSLKNDLKSNFLLFLSLAPLSTTSVGLKIGQMLGLSSLSKEVIDKNFNKYGSIFEFHKPDTWMIDLLIIFLLFSLFVSVYYIFNDKSGSDSDPFGINYEVA